MRRRRPRGGFGVSHARFTRRQRQRSARARKGVFERFTLDGITERGARAVGRHVKRPFVFPERARRLDDHARLRRPVRCGERGASSVLPARARAHDERCGVVAVAAVAVAVARRTEHVTRRRLGASVPVRRRVERFTPPVRREHPRRAHHLARLSREHVIHPDARVRRRVGPIREGEMNRHETRRTRRVHRHRGARKSKDENHAPGARG